MARQSFHNKTVLITGGTGSFGQQFVQTMLATYHPKRLIVFSRDELKQWQMRQRFADRSLRFFLGDVRDLERLKLALQGVDVVVHAAALKQIPTLEYNPFEAIKTNVLGSQNVIQAALDQDVKLVMLVSSDKAANPANLYGATKLCAERLFVASNAYAGNRRTRFSAVRYGNVIGSRGSVIQLFERMRSNGLITITDPRMTRFWITLEQGVGFVIRCLQLMQGGEIFIPKLPSMKVVDLAKVVAPACRHRVIGIRPGEKLHEVLVTPEEARRARELGQMFLIEPEFVWREPPPRYPGKPLRDGFTYSSDRNPQWLTPARLRKMLDGGSRAKSRPVFSPDVVAES